MLAADIQYETLARSLLIAALVVSPYGIHKVRQVRAHRRELAARAAAEAAPPPPTRPRLEDVIDTIDRLGRDRDTGAATVAVPTGVTVDGDDPPPGLVDVLVRDALRRSGLATTAEVDTAEGRVLEVRRVAP